MRLGPGHFVVCLRPCRIRSAELLGRGGVLVALALGFPSPNNQDSWALGCPGVGEEEDLGHWVGSCNQVGTGEPVWWRLLGGFIAE